MDSNFATASPVYERRKGEMRRNEIPLKKNDGSSLWLTQIIFAIEAHFSSDNVFKEKDKIIENN